MRVRLAIVLLLAPPLLTAPASAATLGQQDRQFLEKAIHADLAASAFASLAEQKAKDPAVKGFARQVAATHDRLDHRLDALAQAKDVTPPRTLDKEMRDLHDNIAAVTGAEFDHLYMRQAVGDARGELSLYESEAMHGSDHDVLGLVADALPVLRQEYADARAAEAKLPGTAPLRSPSGVVETRRPSGGGD
jgi:putative membrane protein